MTLKLAGRSKRPLSGAKSRRIRCMACAEVLEERMLLSATLDPISAQTVPGGKALFVPLTGTTDQAGLNYSVQSDNGAVTASVITGVTFMKLTVAGFGDMVFALYGSDAPNTVAHITNLVNTGFYTNLIFHRVYPGFVLQTGSPNGDGTGGSGTGNVGDEFTPDSLFAGDGQLAMANSGADTNDSQFFITIGAQRSLDFTYTMFGQLVRGFDVRNAIAGVPLGPGNTVDSINTRPVTPVVITSATMITDTTDAVLKVTGTAGQTANITVTADDGMGNQAQQSFLASAVTDSVDDPPYLHPLTNQTTHVNTPLDIPIAYTDVENSAGITTANGAMPDATASTITLSNFHVVPNTNFIGDISAIVGVHEGTGRYSTHQFTVHVTDAAPTLTTISQIPGASQDTNFTLSYATLLAASDLADADDTPLFQIQTVSNGTLTKGGTAVTAGTTTLGPGESVVWHSNPGDAGNLTGFTVKGFDGVLTSASAVGVVFQTAQVNHAPTLTTVTPFSGGHGGQDYSITFAQLLAASDAHDTDNYDSVKFQIEAVSSGTLKINGIAVVLPQTFSSGQTLTWTPPTSTGGTLNAFTVRAYDTKTTSASDVQVQVGVSTPTLTTVQTLGGGIQGTDYGIDFASFLGVTDAALDGGVGTPKFRIMSVTSGTLTINGVAVVAGTTVFGPGDSLLWHPLQGNFGVVNAFTVKATDGTNDSPNAIPVTVNLDARPTLSSIATLSSGPQDTPFTITYAALKAASDLNDANDSTTVGFRVESVTTGTLTKNGVAVTPGSTTLGVGESLVWTPASKAIGTLNAFVVRGFDGALASNSAVQVTATVTARVGVDTVADQTVPGGKSLIVPLTGSTTGNDPLTYSVTTPAGITGTILTGNIWVKMTVAGLGDMVFQFFNDMTPTAAGRIETLIGQGFYNGLTFHRIITGFVAQGGDPNGDGSGGSGVKFDDEWSPNLIYSGTGQLGLANTTPDTNDSQFFITQGAQRFLDYNEMIFGQLVKGFDVFSALMARGSSDGTPSATTTITSMSVIADTTDAVLLLNSASNTAGGAVTVTATSAGGYSAQKSFNVTSFTDTTDDPPYLNPIGNLLGTVNQTVSTTLSGTDIDGDGIHYAWGFTDSTVNATGSLDPTTHVLTITPNPGFTGQINIIVGAAALNPPTDGSGHPTRGSRQPSGTGDQTFLYDTQVISLTIPGLLVSANGSRVFSGQGAAVDLGAQLTGGTGPTVTFTLTNESSTDITLSNEVVPTGFRAAGTFPTTVPAGGTATFMVQLDTSTSGGKAGTLTFGSSDTSMPTFSIPLSGTVGTNFVRNLYEQILRRDPDQAGQDYWNNLILTGQSTPGQITAGFVNSTEYRSIRIADLYSQILGRGIDSGGLQYWLGYFAGGGSLEQIEAGFYGSDEYFNAHGGTNSSVVNSFYQALLGRGGDPAGLSFWVNSITSGTSRTDVVSGFITSLEQRDKKVIALYQDFLHRSPDTAGMNFWVNSLGNGQGEFDVITAFLSSNEYFAS